MIPHVGGSAVSEAIYANAVTRKTWPQIREELERLRSENENLRGAIQHSENARKGSIQGLSDACGLVLKFLAALEESRREVADLRAELHDTQTQESLLDRQVRDLKRCNDNQTETIVGERCSIERLELQLSEIKQSLIASESQNDYHKRRLVEVLQHESAALKSHELLAAQLSESQRLVKDANRACTSFGQRNIELARELDRLTEENKLLQGPVRPVWDSLCVAKADLAKERAKVQSAVEALKPMCTAEGFQLKNAPPWYRGF